MDAVPKQTPIRSFIRQSWLHHKNRRERQLLAVIGILILFVLALITVLLIGRPTTSESTVCTSSECVLASARILNTIDLTADPCNDFYQFSCGTFIKNTNIPEEKSVISSFTLIRDKVEEQLKAVVEEEPIDTAPKQYHFVKKIFTMCMNSTEVDTNTLPIAKAIIRSLGGWPLLEGPRWNDIIFDWTKYMFRYRKVGIGTNFFISVVVTPDLKNSSRRVITVAEATLDLDREYLIKGVEDPIIKAYYDYIVDLSVLYGSNRDAALSEMKETLDFEIKLAKICSPQEDARNLTALYNPMKIKDMQLKYPFISWLDFLTNILYTPVATLTDEETVIVEVPQFLVKLEVLLRETPNRVLANYIMRVVANSLVSNLSKQLRDRKLLFNSVLSGQTASRPRWQECLAVARKIGKYPVEASYVRKYFNRESKAKVSEIVANIKSVLEDRLSSLEWIDNITKRNALEKLSAMRAFVGYPDELMEDANVEEYYSKMEFNSDNYLQSMIDYSIFQSNEHYSKLRKSFNKTDWKEHAGASIVNAFYLAVENGIILPAGVLQDVFYENNRPQYINYGGIGSTVGHELIHGFDDEGSQYDKDGNIRDWWGESTKRAFLKKTQCIIEQYGNYTVPEIGININGLNTQGENIADLGGVILSYLAYQKWVEENGPELYLPGLEFTPNQLFWISAAKIECEKKKLEFEKMSVTTGSHSPGIFRVNGVYSNTPYFAKDFKCATGTKMNPVHKCSVW